MLRNLPLPPSPRLDRASGDALVLFVTDDTGRVTEAAVAEPVGNGFDALAERLVLAMTFEPLIVEGLPARLRSQVLVRFSR